MVLAASAKRIVPRSGGWDCRSATTVRGGVGEEGSRVRTSFPPVPKDHPAKRVGSVRRTPKGIGVLRTPARPFALRARSRSPLRGAFYKKKTAPRECFLCNRAVLKKPLQPFRARRRTMVSASNKGHVLDARGNDRVPSFSFMTSRVTYPCVSPYCIQRSLHTMVHSIYKPLR